VIVPVEPGVRIHVEDSGGPGRPVVFLHGWPLDGRQWEYQVADLQPRGYRCIAVDARGFGRSDHAWGHYGLDVLADDLGRVVDALDVDGFALVGMSLGAATAARYVRRHGGGRATHLVVVAPVALDPGRAAEMQARCRTDRPALLREVIAGFGVGEVARAWLCAIAEAAMPYATRRCLALLSEAEPEPVDVPALIVRGTEDAWSSEAIARRWQQAIPGARTLAIARAGHGAFLTHQHDLNAALAAFIGPAAPTRAERPPET
jgi:non-heme chloroperoxidase